MEAIEAGAEKTLATLVYHGEKPRYNFETHVSKHLRAHLDIEKAGGVLNERQKVRKLVESLQASFLSAAIAQVRAKHQSAGVVLYGTGKDVFYGIYKISILYAGSVHLV